MNAETFNGTYRKRFEKLSTTNLSDALDRAGRREAVRSTDTTLCSPNN